MFNIIPLKYAHLCLDMFITEGFMGFYKIVMCYLVYLKEEIMCMEDMSDILTRFSSTHNQEKVDWESILEAALRFKITEHDILNLKWLCFCFYFWMGVDNEEENIVLELCIK